MLFKIFENNTVIYFFEIHFIISLLILIFLTKGLVFKIIDWNFRKVILVFFCLFCFTSVVAAEASSYSEEILQERLFIFSYLIWLLIFIWCWWNAILFFYHILFCKKLWLCNPFWWLSYLCHTATFKWIHTCGKRNAHNWFAYVSFYLLITGNFLVFFRAYNLRNIQ